MEFGDVNADGWSNICLSEVPGLLGRDQSQKDACCLHWQTTTSMEGAQARCNAQRTGPSPYPPPKDPTNRLARYLSMLRKRKSLGGPGRAPVENGRILTAHCNALVLPNFHPAGSSARKAPPF